MRCAYGCGRLSAQFQSLMHLRSSVCANFIIKANLFPRIGHKSLETGFSFILKCFTVLGSRPKETLINTFLPFFKMAKRTLRFNQLFPNF